MKLFHADISQGYDSDRKEKDDGSTDVPNREKRQVSKRTNGLQWKTNKGMADKRRLSKPYGSTGKHYAYSSDRRTRRLRRYVCRHTERIHSSRDAGSDSEERVTVKITGVLVDMLVQLSPEIYGPYIVFEKQ